MTRKLFCFYIRICPSPVLKNLHVKSKKNSKRCRKNAKNSLNDTKKMLSDGWQSTDGLTTGKFFSSYDFF